MGAILPATTTYEHVQLDANGIPIIAGTTQELLK